MGFFFWRFFFGENVCYRVNTTELIKIAIKSISIIGFSYYPMGYDSVVGLILFTVGVYFNNAPQVG